MGVSQSPMSDNPLDDLNMTMNLTLPKGEEL